MSDQRVGAALRAIRHRRGWRQLDLAERAGVSDSLVSSLERGHLGSVTLDSLRGIAAVLEIRIDVVPRWRGADLDRLLNSRHAALTEAVAAYLGGVGWEVAVEVSFSIRGERGFIDLLAWHAASRCLLVIEIKTEIADVQEVVGVLDRKSRLAGQIARDRGWFPLTVSTWLVIAEGSTNRHRVDRYSNLLRSAFPADGRDVGRWLQQPIGRLSAMSFFSDSSRGRAKQGFAGRKRVRVRR